MRRREIDSGQLPDADDTWWAEQSIDERLEFDPSRYFQEVGSVPSVEPASQIDTEEQPRHAAPRSIARGTLALLRRGTPRHRGGSDV